MEEINQNISLNTSNDLIPNIPSFGVRIGKCDKLIQSSQLERITKVVALVIVFLFCTFGNSLVIFLVCRTKKLHKDMSYFIVNMAVSDMLVVALSLQDWFNILFYNTTSWKMEGLFGTITCKLSTLLSLVAPIASITTLIAISVERLRAVSSPLRVQPVGRLMFCSLLALSWMFPIAVYSYILYVFDIITYKGEVYCTDVYMDRPGWVLYHFVFYAILVTLFVFLIALNLTITKKLYKSQDAVSLPDDQKKKREQKFIRAVRMIICCSVLFVIGWGPRSCLKFLDHLKILKYDYCAAKNLYFVIDFLFYLNFSLSPIVYFIFLKDFSDALRKVVSWNR